MIFRHKRTNVLYRRIMDAFQVERQTHSVVYMSMETGEVFVRDLMAFAENFEFYEDPQSIITRREPHE